MGIVLAIAIAPLPITAKVTGTVIAVLMLLLCVYFWRRQQTQRQDTTSQRLRPPVLRSFLYGTVGVSAVVLLAGVWIDPGRYPQMFVAVWMVELFLVMFLVALAMADAAVVGRRGIQQQHRLLDEHQRDLRRQIENFRNEQRSRDAAGPRD